MKDISCCVKQCDTSLDATYWDNQYQENTIGWDLGMISPAMQSIIESITDKSIAILIPGCGNTYEAEFLLSNGFSNITVIDIAPTLIQNLHEKFKNNPQIKIIQGDFFEHQGNYDLIIEQTFFCALPPYLRAKYVWKMHQLLKEKGKLTGLLFNRSFEVNPPFGGNKAEYETLFVNLFELEKLEECLHSALPRMGSELLFSFIKKPNVVANLYELTGISCSHCVATVTQKLLALPEVLSVQISSNFSYLLLVSGQEIPLAQLQDLLSDEPNYTILKI